MTEQPREPAEPVSAPASPPPAVPPPPPGVPPPPTTASATAGAATSMLAGLGQAEQLALLGAVLVLFVEIVFGLILEEYGSGDLSTVAAAAVVAAVWIHARGGRVPLGYATVIRVAGFVIAVVAVVSLVNEVRGGVFDRIADILGGLGYYAGAALMAIGAWTIRDA